MNPSIDATGVLRAAASSLMLECPGMGTCAIQLSGTWVGTLVFEVSVTKDTWTTLNVLAPNSTSTVTGSTSNGLWSGPVAGMHAIRVRCSAFTSGEIGVTLKAVPLAGGGASGGGGGSGGTSSAVGGAFPGTATAVGFIDSGGNMAGANLDASGNLKVSGSLSVAPTAAATSTLSNVSGSATSVTVLAANASRYGFSLYNDSTSLVYVKLGATASATSFTKPMLPNEQWSTRDLGVNYVGKIDAIWVSAAGAMRVTELAA